MAADMPVATGMMRDDGPRPASPGRRLHGADVEWIAERLSDRDWQVIEVINRLRLVSGKQVELLCFDALQGHAREVVRGRVLRRLVDWQVLSLLPRRVGGAARGSAGAIYALGQAGARLWDDRQLASGRRPRVRQPGVPTDRTVNHTVAVSELYAQLVTLARRQPAHVLTYLAEPASWWPNGLRGWLKPDAYTLLAAGAIREHWWIEVDQATESLPTIRRKLRAYLDFVARGQLGPSQVMPRVLISAITADRTAHLQAVVEQLPSPATDLFVVQSAATSATSLLRSLQE